jgi:mutator protein MutT
MDNTGNRHLAVVAILQNNDNKVLLIQRNEPEAAHIHGKWHFPGGGIEFGEDPADAVLREITEEVGDLEVQLLSRRPIIFSHHYEKDDIHAIVLGFPVMCLSGDIDLTREPTVGDARWFSISEVDDLDTLPEIATFVSAISGI